MDYKWFYMLDNENLTPMPYRSRRTRCSSSRELQNTGTEVLEIDRHRDVTEWEDIHIYSRYIDFVSLPSKWMCEECAEIFMELRKQSDDNIILGSKSMQEYKQEREDNEQVSYQCLK